MNRRYAIFASDVRRLGGIVSVAEYRDRTDCEPFFIVGHLSRGGDVAFRSWPIRDGDQARAAAQVLAQFTGAQVRS